MKPFSSQCCISTSKAALIFQLYTTRSCSVVFYSFRCFPLYFYVFLISNVVERHLCGILRAVNHYMSSEFWRVATFHTFPSLFVFYIEILINCQDKGLKEFWCTLLLKYSMPKTLQVWVKEGRLDCSMRRNSGLVYIQGTETTNRGNLMTHCILKTINFTEDHETSTSISGGNKQ